MQSSTLRHARSAMLVEETAVSPSCFGLSRRAHTTVLAEEKEVDHAVRKRTAMIPLDVAYQQDCPLARTRSAIAIVQDAGQPQTRESSSSNPSTETHEHDDA
mmetsp:Transcript_56480/g.89683  ORF Transcript_56480/g.89683 Transcript_56480/m.89683 type:complete len:102 (+) Transcript_56480:72-377(+)|eukprot:CAMPEP_0169106800 /NCGR_PEP_ID=MMETSP1015-20121227/24536_1 /TAXON_ID=342587 /ORGANISM="Karlodinium micrum, Strain CCMP2283" /LENGTH=101 /DNA_ID=CAMNT_0009168277 /DNA_START=72 /DNA_END=377 /DNA_ORIENTATION=+